MNNPHQFPHQNSNRKHKASIRTSYHGKIMYRIDQELKSLQEHMGSKNFVSENFTSEITMPRSNPTYRNSVLGVLLEEQTKSMVSQALP